ncbi:peptide MFS transporter [Virgibacillus halodenitrificans]|jgi:proton-dependent oligopeptide transporter, POT family|uniref:MFS transporter n=1 Tax=Virgibacillus halodenitrificans TaxID=1482 RepID=A0AAC9NKF2_VIRHA|nr:peptide MFS transporter [Virgibacillus halodenitrificans]APC47963.1 MFS transporter [Virgibacillus halodenitrificans]MCG1028954.1 peptide MFS transporter [Virgibacillus halodenitrificans]MCJ0933220.1 peptide MFS transporter [Virgibacillus halodenitrificans]MEC2160820.1 peptide MFS transporter [Virgibacillus halodenitrificans]CDQ37663.1 Di-/tripeptide transporter [Virgibacillus halodenitrificans]
MNTHDKKEIVRSVPQQGFFGQPKGLFTLFFTEFWERFSYYGMRALLLFYMYNEVAYGGLGIEDETARSIMAIYGSLVYMSGIIGGWIADRLLGTQRTVFYGGALIMAGHIVLALPAGLTAFFISMLLIIVGTGLLKPNVSNMVGDMYAPEDNRRDSGFSIFYMGINMGAFIAPFVVGTLGQEYNYHLGFGTAAVGMFLGLIVFIITKKKNLGLAGTYVPNPLEADEKKKVYSRFGIGAAIIALLAVITIPTGILTINRFTYLISILGILIPATYFIVMYRSPKTNADEKSRLIAYIPLFIAAMMFWAIQEQGSIILAEYADKRTQLEFLGIEIQSSWFQSLNPLFIIALAPMFAGLWVKLGDRQPSTTKKFSFGLFFAGLSFLIMIIPSFMHGTDSLVSPIWLVLSFLIVVLGELCLSPVGLSATTKLAPAAFSAQTMSLWFLSNASAQAINAQIVKFYDPATEIIYFGVIGGFSILLGIILYAFAPLIQKYMRGVR